MDLEIRPAFREPVEICVDCPTDGPAFKWLYQFLVRFLGSLSDAVGLRGPRLCLTQSPRDAALDKCHVNGFAIAAHRRRGGRGLEVGGLHRFRSCTFPVDVGEGRAADGIDSTSSSATTRPPSRPAGAVLAHLRARRRIGARADLSSAFAR